MPCDSSRTPNDPSPRGNHDHDERHPLRPRDPDLVVEASGAPSGLALSIQAAALEACIVMIGITGAAAISAPLNQVQAKNLVITGVTGAPRVWPDARRFIDRAGIDLRGLVTGTCEYSRAPEALTAVEDPDSMKIHLLPDPTTAS